MNYVNNSKYYNKKKNHKDFLVWESFKKLKMEYSDTQYYNEIISECEYFEKYIDEK